MGPWDHKFESCISDRMAIIFLCDYCGRDFRCECKNSEFSFGSYLVYEHKLPSDKKKKDTSVVGNGHKPCVYCEKEVEAEQKKKLAEIKGRGPVV